MEFRFQSYEHLQCIPVLCHLCLWLVEQSYRDSAEVTGFAKPQTPTSQPLRGSLFIFACASLIGENKLSSFIFNESSLKLKKM